MYHAGFISGTREMKKNFLILCAFLQAVLLFSCGRDGGMDNETRSFLMGFSPWLYDATAEAQNWVYEKIGSDGDIISHHFEEGIPWQESSDGAAFPGPFQEEIDSRIRRRLSGQKAVLQISPLNSARNGMALYRNDSVNAPLPGPWSGYGLDSPEVKAAFLNYARKMIDAFEPDYLLIGVEVNLLVRNNPALWPAYADLHGYIYAQLKKLYPSLPVSASFFCVPFFDEWSGEDNATAQIRALKALEPHLDFVSFSVHPFMSAILCERLPDDYMKRLFALTKKPVAVSESSYPAQEWSTVSDPVLTFSGSQEKQKNFLQQLLAASSTREACFVIWWTIRDYDALWRDSLGSSDAALSWRDTGLYDEVGMRRTAWCTWKQWQEKPCAR